MAHKKGSRLRAKQRPRQPPARTPYSTLLSTAKKVRTFFEAVCAPFDITGQQYNVLRILRGAEPAGLPTLMIAERMIERTPGITRMVDRLEAKKLVRRDRCESDRRQVLCTITATGLELL